MNLAITRNIEYITDFLRENLYFNRDFHARAEQLAQENHFHKNAFARVILHTAMDRLLAGDNSLATAGEVGKMLEVVGDSYLIDDFDWDVEPEFRA